MQKLLLAGALGLAASLPGWAQATYPALRTEVARLARQTSGRVGVALRVLETNDTLSYHDQQAYPVMSVFKLAVGMAALHQTDLGRLPLDHALYLRPADLPGDTHSPLRDKYPAANVRVPVRVLLHYMLVYSDNNACDILIRQLGGPAAVDAYVRQLGIMHQHIEADEAQMHASAARQYANWSYPSAQVALLAAVYQHPALSKASTALLQKLLLATAVGEKRLKGLLPAGTPVAHRTGTADAGAQGCAPATNDVGVIVLPNGQHVALAVLLRDSCADMAARELLIARIAQAVYQEFAAPR